MFPGQEAGLNPVVAATSGGALGLEDAVGSVEQGRVADLVIVRSNPMTASRTCVTLSGGGNGGTPQQPKRLMEREVPEQFAPRFR